MKKKFFILIMCIFTGIATIFSINTYAFNSDNEDIVTIVEDDDIGDGVNQINYSDGWNAGTGDSNSHDGTYHWAQIRDGNEASKSFQLKFYGKQIELYAHKRTWFGIYEISIDGNPGEMVNAQSSTNVWSTLLYDSGKLSEGEHTLTFVFDKANQELDIQGIEANIDYFKVYSTPIKPTGIEINEKNIEVGLGETAQFSANVLPNNASVKELEWSVSDISKASIDENGLLNAYGVGKVDVQAKVKGTEIVDQVSVNITSSIEGVSYISIVNDATEGKKPFEVTYNGIWGKDVGYPEYYYQGDSHWSNSNSFGNTWPSYSMDFIGKKIELYGNRDKTNGIYEISIDGKKVGKVDIYNDGPRIRQQKIFESDILEDGKHSINVTLLEEKNPEAEDLGYEMSFDFAKVYHNDIPLESIILEKDSMRLEEGMTEKLGIMLNPSYTTNKNPTFKYHVEKPDIATVDENGVITALKKGNTKISVTVDNTDITKIMNLEVVAERGNLRATVVDTDHHYYQDDYEVLTKQLDFEWNGTAWKNDEMISEIALTTLNEKASNVKVIASDFKNEDGDIFSANNITINYLRETSAFIGHGAWAGGAANQPHIDVPDIIYKNGSINIDSQRVQSVWINITTPKDTKPGLYSGKIHITSDEQDDIVLNYSFEVLDIMAPSSNEYEKTLELWEYPFSVAGYYGISQDEVFGERHLKILEENLKLYQAAGGSVATSNILDCNWGINYPISSRDNTVFWYREADGSISYDYTRFDKWIELNEKMGIADKIKLFSVSNVWNNLINRETGKIERIEIPIGSNTWYKFWGDFLEDFIPHLEKKGWTDKTYFAVDEIGEDNIKEFLKLLNQNVVNGKKLKLSAAVNYSHMSEETMMQIDDVSISLDYIGRDDATKHIIEQRHELGLNTSFYTCVGTYPNSFALNNPVESAWTIWYNNALGFDGYLRWAYNNWTPNPSENLDYNHYEAGDTMLVYPDPDSNAENPVTYSTPRFENLKQAKRDIEKLNYLMKQNKELEDEGKKLLDSLGRKEGVYNSYGGKYAASEEDAEYIVAEVNRMRDGLEILSKKYVKSNEPIKEANKTALKIAIDIANEVTEKQLNNIVPAVANKFIDALKNATATYDNANATQTEVNDAFDELANIMKYLSFFKGDKDALETFMNKVASLNEAEYLTNTWTPFDDAKAQAQTILDDVNAMQEEVDSAYDTLVRTFLDLRLRPNKDALQDLINQANSLSEANYTTTTFKVFNNVLEEAKAVMANEEATSEEVAKTQDALTKAINGLQVITSSKIQPSEKASNVKPDNNTPSVDTGDDNLAGLFVELGLLSMIGIFAGSKRRKY